MEPHGPMGMRNVDIIIECAVCGWKFDETADGALVANPGYTETDDQLEAKLDAMEQQVRFALRNPLSQWAGHWGAMVQQINSWTSGRWADEADSRTPLAIRVLKINVRICDDAPPRVETVDGAPSIVFGVARSVQGLLDAIVADAQGGEPVEYVADIAAMLSAGGMPTGVTLPPLKTVSVKTRSGPDGRAPVESEIDFGDD